jgi:tRNA pseudouridine13 synthase
VLIAANPEDFRVDEVALYSPSGSGDHTFVRIEKRLRNTEEVARELARLAGVAARDVGYAGRKDRVALARQWLSVPGLDPERAQEYEGRGFRVLEAVRHPHKLRTGQLRANRFELVVRELSGSQLSDLPAALARVKRLGMPNRFGAQRFGRGGDNADRGRALLAGASPGRERRAARFWLSALQAEIFNAALAERTLSLDALEAGEVAWIHASGAAFLVEDVAREQERAARFEISPSGPLVGTRLLQASGEPGRREAALFARHGIPERLQVPRGIRLRGARRPLRVRPEELTGEPCEAGAARLCFALPPGSYATVLAETLFEGSERTAGGELFAGVEARA